MSKSWKNYRQQRSNEIDDDSAKLVNLGIREDFIYEVKERAQLGKPRLLQLKGWSHPFVRIVPPLNDSDQRDRPGASDRRNSSTVNRIVDRLSDVKSLDGPASIHAVDEMAAKLFAEAQNFAPAIEAIRNSAHVHIRRGAQWLQIKPIVIQSPPGAGKTTFVNKLAAAAGLQLVYLDCSAMSTISPIVSQDSSWGNSRHSEIIEGLRQSSSANLIVCLDELDKLRDYGRHSNPEPSEAVVGLLEKRSAAAHVDSFLQLQVDVSFINWIILVNDLDRLSKQLLDRCQVIRLPPPSPADIGHIAAQEIERRGLEPELVEPIREAVRKGKITSLRKLHKLLDAAAAASSRPRLH